MTDATKGQIHQREEEDDYNYANKSAALLPIGGGESSCVSEQHYVESGSKKVLYLLCIGLKRKGGKEPHFFFEREPWSLIPKKTSFVCPKNTDFVNDIGRRASLFEVTIVPRPRNWTRDQKTWLAWMPQSGSQQCWHWIPHKWSLKAPSCVDKKGARTTRLWQFKWWQRL